MGIDEGLTEFLEKEVGIFWTLVTEGTQMLSLMHYYFFNYFFFERA